MHLICPNRLDYLQQLGHTVQGFVYIETSWIYLLDEDILCINSIQNGGLFEVVLFQFDIECPAADSKDLDGF